MHKVKIKQVTTMISLFDIGDLHRLYDRKYYRVVGITSAKKGIYTTHFQLLSFPMQLICPIYFLCKDTWKKIKYWRDVTRKNFP